MTTTADHPEDPNQLFYDLQQFLFDARDQHNALDELKTQLASMLETTTRQERDFRAVIRALKHQVDSGVTVHADRHLTDAVRDLKAARGAILSNIETVGAQADRAFAILPIATTAGSLLGAIIGIFIGIKVL